MNVSAITGRAPQAADFSDVALLQQKLAECSEALSAMAHDVGQAKHIIEYDSDLRKRALARAMQPALAGGDSAAKAESEGRASKSYTDELNVLAKQHQAATVTITEWDAEKIRWETCRSLLSMIKEQVRQL